MRDYLEEALGFDREDGADWALAPEALWPARAGEGAAGREVPRGDRGSSGEETDGGDVTGARAEETGPLWPSALAVELPPGLQTAEGRPSAAAAAGPGRQGSGPEAEGVSSPAEAPGPGLDSAVPAGALWRGETAGETLPLLDTLKAAERGTRFVQGERRAFSVTLPEPAAAERLSVESLDRAVERDAWRYGGELTLR